MLCRRVASTEYLHLLFECSVFSEARLWSYANHVTSDHLCGFLQKYVVLSAYDMCKLPRVFGQSVESYILQWTRIEFTWAQGETQTLGRGQKTSPPFVNITLRLTKRGATFVAPCRLSNEPLHLAFLPTEDTAGGWNSPRLVFHKGEWCVSQTENMIWHRLCLSVGMSFWTHIRSLVGRTYDAVLLLTRYNHIICYCAVSNDHPWYSKILILIPALVHMYKWSLRLVKNWYGSHFTIASFYYKINIKMFVKLLNLN